MNCITSKLKNFLINKDIPIADFAQLVEDEIESTPFEWYKERIDIDLADNGTVTICDANIITFLACLLSDMGIKILGLALTRKGLSFP
jgi:hypothetical protein